MKKVKFVVAGLVLMIAGLAHAYDDGDFQIWNTDTEEININKNVKVVLEEEFRWGDNASEFFYQHYDAGVFCNLNKNLNAGAGYRHIFTKQKGKFKAENEPYVTATLFWNLAKFKFDDRSRLEYMHFDHQDDAWRYRNKITMKFPWEITKMKIQPFISDEILIRIDDSAHLNQNRASSGLGITLTKNIKAEIYYMLVSSKGGRKWTDANVLGTKLKLMF